MRLIWLGVTFRPENAHHQNHVKVLSFTTRPRLIDGPSFDRSIPRSGKANRLSLVHSNMLYYVLRISTYMDDAPDGYMRG